MSGGVPAGEALGDLPSRIQGWIGKARARGGDRIELDFVTVELLVRLALRGQSTPTPPIEGRDADVERAKKALERIVSIPDDEHLLDPLRAKRLARAALQALGERG